jgi:two-component system chemotaxis response regulator CheB
LTTGPTRILIVDDSALYRQAITNVLRDVQQVKIVGTAKNGIEALEQIDQLDPDVLTLDVQMPDMNGIEVLNEINRRRLRTKAIMVSSLTTQGAQVTTDALMEGAFDFILKPSGGDAEINRQQLKNALLEKIKAFRAENNPLEPEDLTTADDVAPTPEFPCQAVLLGTSTGGPQALKSVLPRLPQILDVPVLVVQHMPPQYTLSLAQRLDSICEMNVVEAQNEMEAANGQIFIAPGGKQMGLYHQGKSLRIRINSDPPEQGVRPAADYLFRSASTTLDGNALAVVMTGMGRDGTAGCRHLKQSGGHVFAQCQSDSVVYGMSKAVIHAGLADRVLPLGKIPAAIVRHVKRSRRSIKENS